MTDAPDLFTIADESGILGYLCDFADAVAVYDGALGFLGNYSSRSDAAGCIANAEWARWFSVH